MTQHEKNLLFQTLQMLRNRVKQSSDFAGDRRSADDHIFATLNFTHGELAEIYAGRNEYIYAGSAIEGFYPVEPTYHELEELKAELDATGATLVCGEKMSAMGKMVCICIQQAGGYNNRIVLTEQDAPIIVSHIGETVMLKKVPSQEKGESKMCLCLKNANYSDIVIYSVQEHGGVLW